MPQVASAPLRLQPLGYALLALLATVLAGTMLRAFPPETSAFYPACPFYQWTGLLCPGCGGTRALAALARGNLQQALNANGLVVIALAGCAAYLGWTYVRSLSRSHPLWPPVPPAALLAAGVCALIFAVLRNLR